MNRFGTSPVKIARTDYYASARRTPRPLGSNAEYRREHYVFARTQSPMMKQATWSERTQPLRSWGMNAVADIAWRLFG